MQLQAINNQVSLKSKIEIFLSSQPADSSVLDNILEFCSIHKIEEETAASAILSNPKLVQQLRVEAEQLHFLSPQPRLPL